MSGRADSAVSGRRLPAMALPSLDVSRRRSPAEPLSAVSSQGGGSGYSPTKKPAFGSRYTSLDDPAPSHHAPLAPVSTPGRRALAPIQRGGGLAPLSASSAPVRSGTGTPLSASPAMSARSAASSRPSSVAHTPRDPAYEEERAKRKAERRRRREERQRAAAAGGAGGGGAHHGKPPVHSKPFNLNRVIGAVERHPTGVSKKFGQSSRRLPTIGSGDDTPRSHSTGPSRQDMERRPRVARSGSTATIAASGAPMLKHKPSHALKLAEVMKAVEQHPAPSTVRTSEHTGHRRVAGGRHMPSDDSGDEEDRKHEQTPLKPETRAERRARRRKERASEPNECWEEFRACCECLFSLVSCSCDLLTRCFSCCKIMSLAQEQLLHEELTKQVVPPVMKENAKAVESMLGRYPPGAVLSLTVRRADLLEPDERIEHPVVRVYIVDLRQGRYYGKLNMDVSAVTAYEYMRAEEQRSSQPLDYILPFMTPPADLKKVGAFSPEWNETVVINQQLNHFFKPYTLFLFELLEFGPKVDRSRFPDGTAPIAWGFLRTLSAYGIPNTGSLRLQLYRYSTSKLCKQPPKERVPPVYYQWVYQKNTQWEPYPSSLWIGVDGVAAPVEREVPFRATLPTDREVGRVRYHELERRLYGDIEEELPLELDQKRLDQLAPLERRAVLRRRQGVTPCLLPTSLLHSISCGVQGCIRLQFSPTGKYIAAAVGERLLFTIKLYDTDTGRHVYTYNGHHDLVYDLSWAADGSRVLSASSDQSVKVWTVTRGSRTATPSLTLQHPCYVYTAKYHPRSTNPRLIFSAGFDGMIRIWNDDTGAMITSLDHHTAYVNSLVFSKDGLRMFSGDANGTIALWHDVGRLTAQRKHAKSVHGGDDHKSSSSHGTEHRDEDWVDRFVVRHVIEHEEVVGDVISHLVYVPRPEMIIAYVRDNALYSFNLRRNELAHKFTGVQCRNQPLRCCVSPDGKYIVVASEDGKAHIFAVKSARLVKTFELGYTLPCYDVCWHPSQHAVAACSFGGDFPILLYDEVPQHQQ